MIFLTTELNIYNTLIINMNNISDYILSRIEEMRHDILGCMLVPPGLGVRFPPLPCVCMFSLYFSSFQQVLRFPPSLQRG